MTPTPAKRSSARLYHVERNDNSIANVAKNRLDFRMHQPEFTADGFPKRELLQVMCTAFYSSNPLQNSKSSVNKIPYRIVSKKVIVLRRLLTDAKLPFFKILSSLVLYFVLEMMKLS